jgi:hypothetical protein
MSAILAWIKTFLARRDLRRKVDWQSCIWSPQKAGEKRFKENLVRHYKELIGIETEYQVRQLAQQMQAGQILRIASQRQHEKAMAEYRRQYEQQVAIHRARTQP